MGRASTRENKNIYQIAREEAKLTLEGVENATNGVITKSKLSKIEGDSQGIHQDDVAILARLYNKPELCNDFCTNQCQIGQQYVPQVESIHDLPQITLQLLSNINSLNKEKERIIDIAADGEISKEEIDDFEKFYNDVNEMSIAIETLKLWSKKTLNNIQ